MEWITICVLLIFIAGVVDSKLMGQSSNPTDGIMLKRKAVPCPTDPPDKFEDCCNSFDGIYGDPKCCNNNTIFFNNIALCCNSDVTLNPVCCDELWYENKAGCCAYDGFLDADSHNIATCCYADVNYNLKCCGEHFTDFAIQCCANKTVFDGNEDVCCAANIREGKCCAELFDDNKVACCDDMVTFDGHHTECCSSNISSNVECCGRYLKENKAACCADNAVFQLNVRICCDDDSIFNAHESECCADATYPDLKCSAEFLHSAQWWVVLMIMFLIRM